MATAKIVTKGPRWTPEMAEKALHECKYIKAGDKTGPRVITGARRMWEKPGHEDDVYLPIERLTGSREEVASILRAAGKSESEIAHALANAYTKESVLGPNATKREAFEREEQACRQYRQGLAKKSEKPFRTISEMAELIKGISGSNTSSKKAPNNKKKSTNATTTTTTNKGPRTSLSSKIKNLAAGKVIDVSKMNEDGTGAKTANQPKPSSKKIGVEGLPLVSSNPETYARAISILISEGDPDLKVTEEYITKYNEMIKDLPSTESEKSKPVEGKAPVPTSTSVPPSTSVPSSTSAPAPPSQPIPKVTVPPSLSVIAKPPAPSTTVTVPSGQGVQVPKTVPIPKITGVMMGKKF